MGFGLCFYLFLLCIFCWRVLDMGFLSQQILSSGKEKEREEDFCKKVLFTSFNSRFLSEWANCGVLFSIIRILISAFVFFTFVLSYFCIVEFCVVSLSLFFPFKILGFLSFDSFISSFLSPTIILCLFPSGLKTRGKHK